jgi:hypothetical protein
MPGLEYGRKNLSFDQGTAVLTNTSVTVRAQPGENEAAFTQRLLKKYQGQRGTIELVFKKGCPDYAIVTLF